MLKPVRSDSFSEYVDDSVSQRVDVVFDECRDVSLKAAITMKTGTGMRIRVQGGRKLLSSAWKLAPVSVRRRKQSRAVQSSK